jgi:diaminohydroxyphosphoribosylaminopyrimidine deaminase/5-amino-6-(5-phosphoribosylamino)uracil reductase
MYVSLEPCCHFGKTPPCVNAIIAAGIKKVVAAVKDPTQKIAGKGFAILKKAGIEVVAGVCESQAKELNAPFFKFAKTGKPYVIIKWAQSKDGFLSRSDGKRWITNAASRKDVHKIRRKVGAILVGVNTVIEDNPMLTARPDRGKQPVRVVLDSKLRIPLDCNLIKTAKQWPICVFTTVSKKIKAKGVETIQIKNKINLKAVLAELGKRGIQQLLVEGGEKIITSFLKQKLADEVIVYTSNEKLAQKGRIKISPVMNQFYR